jgi:H+-transporting ATPase
MVIATGGDILIISLLALSGIEMRPVSLMVLASVFAAAVLFGFVLDFVKVPVFRRFGII